MAEESGKIKINSIDRALDVLIYIYKKQQPVRLADMARDMQESKSTLYRVVSTLENKGFLTKDPESGKYWLGLKLLAIGSCVQDHLGIGSAARPYMHELYEEVNEVINLSVLQLQAVDVPKIVVVEKEESNRQVLRANPSIGAFSNCHSSAAGKCLIAFTGQYDVFHVEPYPLTHYTEHTITSWDKFLDEIRSVQEKGYALDLEEREYGLTCVGAPILDRSGKAIAALSIAGPSYRMNSRLDELIDKTKTEARKISEMYR